MSYTPAGAKSSTENYDLARAATSSPIWTLAPAPCFFRRSLARPGLQRPQRASRWEGLGCSVDCAARQQSGGCRSGFDGGKTIQVTYENLIQTVVVSGKTFCYLSAGDSGIVADPLRTSWAPRSCGRPMPFLTGTSKES